MVAETSGAAKPEGSRRRGRPTRLRALALSLALHAVLGLLLWQGLPRNPLPARAAPEQEALEIELLAEESPAPAAAPDPAAGDAPAPRPTSPVRARERPSAPVDREQPPPPPEGTPPLEPAPSMPNSLPAAPRRLPGLTPSFETIERLTREGAIAAPDPSLAPPPASKPPSRFAQQLAERARNDGARANVVAGKVHPQLYDFLRDARKGFAPNPAALDADPRAPNTVARSFNQWGKGVGEMYRGWQRGLDGQRRRRLDHDPDRRGAPDVLENYNRLMEGTARAVEPMDCLVCLVVRADAPPEVVLASSSGNAEVDRAAVEALRRSANTRPLDPDVRAQRTCYRFRATVHRIPPIPIVGCGFDEVALTASCYYPTMKVRKTTVNLESVDYGG